MNSVVVEAMPTSHLTLSTKLVYKLGDPNSTLRATADRSGPSVVIYAGGEVDACNEDTWRHLVREAGSGVTAPGPFVVDVSGLDFMGCCAFAVLAEEAHSCRERGIDLRVVTCAPFVTRVVDACGLGGVLPIYPTVDSALSAPARC
ncbi:anti-sigma factor antagonist [Mycobacterium sp. 94-17]|uniref:anti-sigma factor antagonist n=1 Tax=Mycobacterium sp. 94-17 TaxID=2986147 RepID=UPI002D1F57FA|nr:anti-sigma factor antagonist [Mycobacterium sp. 94-17]MEB4210904.1 anti-sigma factor antagonist [Mycobacterium sp. 94-17]